MPVDRHRKAAMKTKKFQVLLDELGGLTPIQSAVLMAALKSSNSADDAVSLLEAEFAKAPACGCCGAEGFAKWGVATGMKCYMCKTCNGRFNAPTGTPLAHLRKREKWLDYARAIVDGLTLRKAAARVGVHLETSFRYAVFTRAERSLLFAHSDHSQPREHVDHGLHIQNMNT